MGTTVPASNLGATGEVHPHAPESITTVFASVLVAAAKMCLRDPELRAELLALRVETRSAGDSQRHLSRAEYASSRGISPATVSKLVGEGLPIVPVDTGDAADQTRARYRIDGAVADEWRRTRKRTAPTKLAPKDGIEVGELMARAGLRAIGGSR